MVIKLYKIFNTKMYKHKRYELEKPNNLSSRIGVVCRIDNDQDYELYELTREIYPQSKIIYVFGFNSDNIKKDNIDMDFIINDDDNLRNFRPAKISFNGKLYKEYYPLFKLYNSKDIIDMFFENEVTAV